MYNELVLNEKQFRQKIHKLEKELKEKNLHSTDEIDSLQNQLKLLQKQFDQLTAEHSKAMAKLDRNKNQIHENEQHLQDEVQRLRRDLGLELYRKQDAEKKVRSLEDKLRQEQTQLQKVQYDYTQTKHELKTLQVRYDALQLELIDMHKNNKQNSHLMLPSLTASTINDEPVEQRPIRTKRRTNDEFHHEPETKKPKRTTRSRSTASSNNTSFDTHEQDTNKRPKRTTRNGSTASTSKAIPVAIKHITKKSTEVKIFFLFSTATDIRLLRICIFNLHQRRKVNHERQLFVVEQRKQLLNQYRLISNHLRIPMQLLNEINHLIEHHLQRLLSVRRQH